MQINIDTAVITEAVKARNAEKLEQLGQIVLDDSNEYLPRDQDTLLASGAVNVESDEKVTIGWYTKYARFLYHGKVMVGKESRSAWAKRGETKEVIDTALQYSTDKNPNAQKEWFEAAKKKHGSWAAQIKALFGGG